MRTALAARSRAGGEPVKPPFLYEIRVKGRLSGEQWTAWFDDLTVSTDQGRATLRGSVPDHAALYGLLARLRDLAIPLVAVKVLDAEAQRKLHQQSRRYDLMINALLVAVYLVLLGGLTTITVFVAPDHQHGAGAGAAVRRCWAGWRTPSGCGAGRMPWRWITYVTWPAAAITFVVYHPGLGRAAAGAWASRSCSSSLAGGLSTCSPTCAAAPKRSRTACRGGAARRQQARPPSADADATTNGDTTPDG